MNLEELWKVLDKERGSSTLQKLSDDFYEKVNDYILELRDEKNKMDPDDSKAILIEDELKTARIRIESIFNKRLGKIINLASSKVSGLMEQPNGLITSEKEIFEGVAKIIEEGRNAILSPVLTGIKKSTKTKEPKKENKEKKILMPVEDKAAFEQKNIMKNFALVRILRDIPTFVGANGRNYTASKEDVMTLPLANAEVLCNRGAALKITFLIPLA